MKLTKQMIGVAACSALLVLGGTVYAQGNEPGQNQNQQGNSGNPFKQTTDSGDEAHVFPTSDVLLGSGVAPTLAPKNGRGQATVYPASYGSGNLINHGGPQIPNASYYPVFWNSSVANSSDTSPGYASISAQIQAFVLAFGSGNDYSGAPTDDLSILQQYGNANPISSKLPLLGPLVDTQPTQSSISDSGIRSWLKGLFNSHRLTPSASTLYGLYFPSGMKITMNIFTASCTQFCGYHSSFSYNGKTIKYAVYPYANCSGCKISGLSVADMLTIVSSHEVREAISDPLGNAWYDSAGDEADDKCVWHNLYPMTNGGFWVQPEYSNGGTVTASGFSATYAGPGCVRP
jgi:hypothetical protein